MREKRLDQVYEITLLRIRSQPSVTKVIDTAPSISKTEVEKTIE